MMEFDERRIDLVKTSIKNVNSGQKIISKSLDYKIHVHWPKEDEYLGNESILDHMTCDDANWSYENDGMMVVEREIPKENYELEDLENLEDNIKTEKVKVVKLKVHTRKDEGPLIDLARNNPEPHVRIAAINKIENSSVLCTILADESEEKSVKQACLDRLSELYIE